MKKGFDYKKYIEAQSSEVFRRLNLFDRLYLEFGGKLCYDMHASRVLPGYKKTTKIDLLNNLKEIEIIYCVNAKNLEGKKVLGDFGLNYFDQVIKDIKLIEKFGFKVNYVVITRYEGEKRAKELKKRIEKKDRKVFFHKEIPEYPNNMKQILQGYDKQPFLNLNKKLVIVTGAAGGSGKMAVALSQIYKEKKLGKKTGFAKFETFPIWDLPLSHPINIAYEAATADLGDFNRIDPYHKKAYNKKAVNYNRDIENFTILKKIFSKINGAGLKYNSPTDMGINKISQGIIDDKICRKAAIKEIKRRYKVYNNEYKKGRERKETLERMKEILAKIN